MSAWIKKAHVFTGSWLQSREGDGEEQRSAFLLVLRASETLAGPTGASQRGRNLPFSAPKPSEDWGYLEMSTQKLMFHFFVYKLPSMIFTWCFIVKLLWISFGWNWMRNYLSVIRWCWLSSQLNKLYISKQWRWIIFWSDDIIVN